MKKQYFIYILLCAYSYSALAVEPKVQNAQTHQKVKNYNSQNVNASVDDGDECDVTGEVPKKPTYMDTWRKVVTLKWGSLSRDDAWNIAATVTSAGVAYCIFKALPAGSIGEHVNNRPPHDNDPFSGFTQEEQQRQRAVLEALERNQERQRQLQPQQQQAERQAQQERDRQRQRREAIQQHQRQQEQAIQQRDEEERVERDRQRREANDRFRQQQEAERVERNRQEQQLQQQRDAQRQQERNDGFDQADLEQALEESRRSSEQEQARQVVEQKKLEQERKQQAECKLAQEKCFRELQKQREVDCSVCFDTKKADEFHVMLNCNHVFCKDCLAELVDTRLVEAQSAKQLNCPDQNCTQKIDVTDIHAITINGKQSNSKNQRVLYDHFAEICTREAVSDNKAMKPCSMKGCNCAHEINNSNLQQHTQCLICKHDCCRSCGYNHPKMTCQDYAAIERDCSDCGIRHAPNMQCNAAMRDKESTDNVANQQVAKHCPNPNCKKMILKNEGCNHMTCGSCSHQFCWYCLAQYQTTRCHSSLCEKKERDTGDGYIAWQ